MTKLKRMTTRPEHEVEEEEYEEELYETTDFCPSGCQVLDNILGGGWAGRGRIVNVVGDKSVGKTQVAIETVTNFLRFYEEYGPWADYCEVESAFDKNYAAAQGMPVEDVRFSFDELETERPTVADFESSMTSMIENKPPEAPGLIVLDSIDPLSTKEELARAIDANTFGTEKAKQLSQLFRRNINALSRRNITIMVVSQIRQKINSVMSFGPEYTVGGGRALDFYTSQRIFLAEIGTIDRVINSKKVPIGIKVKARVTKNKLGRPKLTCFFPILFNFGIDDLRASLDYLKDTGKAGPIIGKTAIGTFMSKITSFKEYQKYRNKANKMVQEDWADFLEELEIPFGKYEE